MNMKFIWGFGNVLEILRSNSQVVGLSVDVISGKCFMDSWILLPRLFSFRRDLALINKTSGVATERRNVI